MVQELQAQDSRRAPVGCEIRKGELDLPTLRNFSKSLENLNSETLYSKWKRTRGDTRSLSGISETSSPPARCMKGQMKQQTRENLFHALQEKVFVPRNRTIGASAIEVIQEQNVADKASKVQEEEGKFDQPFRVILHRPNLQQQTKDGRETIKPASIEQTDKRIIDEVITASSVIASEQKLRCVSEDFRDNDSPPIVAKFVSEETESTKTGDSTNKKSNSMQASPNLLLRNIETPRMNTPECPVELKRRFKSSVVKDENNERSRILKNNSLSLGCTYAVISQPSSMTPRDNSTKNPLQMETSNEMISQEQLAELEEEFVKLKKISLEMDKNDIEEDRINELFDLSEVSLTSPLRCYSELDKSVGGSTRNSSQPTAKALLESIANAADKTEKERIQRIESAFNWIREELDELRAQDKEIMRSFTQIQTGIRNIKHQRSLDEAYEYENVDLSPVDLSASFSYFPIVTDFPSTLTRRASLI